MSDQWQITATLFEAEAELRIGFTATREVDGKQQTTSEFAMAANLEDAHAECRNYARSLGVHDYTFVDRRSAAA